MRSLLLFGLLLRLVHTQTPCEVCGEGKEVENPDNPFIVVGQPPTTCGILDFAGGAGYIPTESCPFLPPVVEEQCGCVGDAVAPTVAPTVKATPAPTDATSDAPVATTPAPTVDEPITESPVAPLSDTPVVSPTDTPVSVEPLVPGGPTASPDDSSASSASQMIVVVIVSMCLFSFAVL